MRRLMALIDVTMGLAALAGSVLAATALIGSMRRFETEPEDTYALAITLILGLVIGAVALLCGKFLSVRGATRSSSLASASIVAVCLAAILGATAFVGFVEARSGDLKLLLFPAIVLAVSAYILWQDRKRGAR